MPSIDARLVVHEARTWIDTPYDHQGRLKGHRVDCAGVIIEAGIVTGAFNLTRADFGLAWKLFKGYGRLPNPRRALKAFELLMVPIEDPRHGDVAYLRWGDGPPMHLAMLATDLAYPTMIHAHGLIGRCTEHSFAGEWPGRVHSWWRYPALV